MRYAYLLFTHKCVYYILWLGGHAQSRRTLVIPWTVACQAPRSMGFSRQEYWSGVPYFSLPGSSIHGIFQARVLERGAIAFSMHIHGI